MSFSNEDMVSRFRGQSFTPVRLTTITGETYDIYHPEMVMVGSTFLMIGTPIARNPAIAKHVNRVAFDYVAGMQDLPTPADGAAT